MKNSGYTLGEFKILDLYLARINPLKPETSRVKITKDEYCELMGIESGQVRKEQLKKYTARFLGNVVTMDRPDGKGGYVQKVLFKTAEYDESKKEIILECNDDEDIIKNFFDLKNVGYVRYILRNTLNLKSPYSYKLYMFLKSKIPANQFTVEIAELRDKMGVTAKRYEKFKFFNQEILKSSIEEINEYTDTFVEIEKVVEKRVVKYLKFKISINNKNPDLIAKQKKIIPLPLETVKEVVEEKIEVNKQEEDSIEDNIAYNELRMATFEEINRMMVFNEPSKPVNEEEAIEIYKTVLPSLSEIEIKSLLPYAYKATGSYNVNDVKEYFREKYEYTKEKATKSKEGSNGFKLYLEKAIKGVAK